MYHLQSTLELTEHTSLEIIWDQWAQLGASVPSTQRLPRISVVDPEALLIFSLSLLPLDVRLKEVVTWWACAGSTMTSVLRVKRLLPFFPPHAKTHLGKLAGIAVAANDLRWKSLATARWKTPCADTGDLRVEILNPASLILRMRLIFGVNPTADVLTYLLGRGNQPATARQIGVATGYGRSSIHRVLEGLTAAKIAGRNKTWPATFMLCAEAWQEMLGRSVVRTDVRRRVGFRRGSFKNTAAPMWLCWTQVFSFLAMLHDACGRGVTSNRHHREVLTDVCDQFHASRKVFIEHNLMLPSLNPYGDQYIWSLQENLSLLSAWYTSNA